MAAGEDRIRYIGLQPMVVAFGRQFHRGKWVAARKLGADALAMLTANPQFESPRSAKTWPNALAEKQED